MLNEPASSIEDRPAVRSSLRVPGAETSPLHDQLRQMVMTVFLIERENFAVEPERAAVVLREHLIAQQGARLTAAFEGQLLTDSESAYAQLDALLATVDHLALFRVEDGKTMIYTISRRVTVQPRSPTINIVLFIATLISVLLVGTDIAISEIAGGDRAIAQPYLDNYLFEIWRGLPYAISILLILGAHELGHYFAARHHKVAVTLPYFLPFPFISPIGTLGAFIQLREPMRNRKVLLDVGAAGPFMGLIFAIPILIIGLATSQVDTVTAGGSVEGNSLLYALLKTIVLGRFYPSGGEDVFLNQLAWAGWAGLLVTALNLLPVGQLDGGHLLYSLIGNRARQLYYPVLILMVALTVLVSQSWLFWLVLLFLFGRVFAAPLDTITPLDPRRRFLAILGLVVFAVTFVPIPLSVVEAPLAPGARETVFLWLMPAALILMTWWTRRRR